MIIRHLLAKNFMSFKELDFNIPEVGLHFVSGEVTGRGMSNSNGAGKSALFEALCFCLYGKTIRGAGKDDVVNRDVGKDCCVAVELEKEDGVYVVMRYRKDTKNANELVVFREKTNLTMGTATATQDLIDDIVGMNWMVFSTAIIFGEQARRFTEAKDSEKKQIFDEILMLHRFQEAQKLVKVDIKKFQSDVAILDVAMSSTSKVLTQMEEDLVGEQERLAVAQEAFKKVSVRVKELKTLRRGHRASRDVFKVELETSITNRETLESQQGMVIAEINKLEKEKVDKVKPLNDKIKEINIKAGVLVEEIRTINNILEGGTDGMTDGEICPTCFGKIDSTNFESVAEHYKQELEEKQCQDDALGVQYKEYTDKGRVIIDKYDKKIENVMSLRMELEDTIDVMREKQSDLKVKIGSMKEKLNTINIEIKLLEGYSEQDMEGIKNRIVEKKKQYTELETEASMYDEKKNNLLHDITYLEFWMTGFGNQGIKSLLLDEIVPELNMRVSQFASDLMDDEILIQFDTESTLKSGETRDKFNVKIVQAGELIQYENCSSGEKARIDVSILLALQSMIFHRNANNSNMVIFDEVFEHLDIIGIERTVNLLKEEAQDKAIFVISHQNELRDYFDNQIIIENHGGESTIGE